MQQIVTKLENGGKRWIRTTEDEVDGFTVRCIWPLCNLPKSKPNFCHTSMPSAIVEKFKKSILIRYTQGVVPRTGSRKSCDCSGSSRATWCSLELENFAIVLVPLEPLGALRN